MEDDKRTDGEAVMPGPPAGAGSGKKPPLDLQQRKRARRRARKRVKILLAVFGVFSVLFLALLVADWQLRIFYEDRYHTQPWIEITQARHDIEDGKVLDINVERAERALSERFVDKQAYVIGKITDLKAEGETDGPPGTTAVVVDVPNYVDLINLHKDEVYLLFPAPAAAPLETGQWIEGRGRVESFGDFRLRMEGTCVRPLSPVERHYIERILPPENLTRESLGYEAAMQNR